MRNQLHASNLIKVMLIPIVLFLLITSQQAVWAAAGGYPAESLGVKTINGVAGLRANIWTAQQPANYVYIRGLVSICSNNPCTNTSAEFETGYTKGTGADCAVKNQLQQYAGYRTLGGGVTIVCGLGNLSDNSWYNFQVGYNGATGHWRARRDGTIVYELTQYPGFNSGNAGLCGAAGSAENPPLGVQCDTMQYVQGPNWVSYDYTNAEVHSNYCFYTPYSFGFVGWGPC